MARKKKYIPQNFESLKGEGDISANIYKSMLMSCAWKKASPRAKALYMTMKTMLYGSTRYDKDGFEEVYRNDNKYFTFNESKWIKGVTNGFELYSDKRAFYQDVAQLIELGFVDCIEQGCNTRTKNLYMFSNRWHNYGTASYKIPEAYKTESMRGTKKLSEAEKAERRRRVEKNAKRKEKLGI